MHSRTCLAAFVVLLASLAPAKIIKAQDEELLKLEGSWLFVEDRTEGRAIEDGGAPMSVRFALRVEQDAVIYPRPRGDERITLDGSKITKNEDDGSVSHYHGKWVDGELQYTLERMRPNEKEPSFVLTRVFRFTDEGLLVHVITDNSSKQVALYRHPEDIELPMPATATIEDIAWLADTWTGTRNTSSIEERWSPPKGGAMLGISRTIRGERMTGFEYLRIVERDNGLVYVAQPGGNAPTEFILTELADRRAVFVNPRHDYPQRIVYHLSNEGLLTTSIGFAKGRLQNFELTQGEE